MMAEHRHVGMTSRQHPQVGLPGRTGGEADEETALRRGTEQRLGLVAQQPAVVVLVEVVRDPGEPVAVVQFT